MSKTAATVDDRCTCAGAVPGRAGCATRPSERARGGEKARDRARHALDSVDEAVLIADEEGLVCQVNRPFEQLFDVSAGQLAGKSRRELLEPFSRKFKDPDLFKKNVAWLYDHPAEEVRSTWELSEGHRVLRWYSRPLRNDDGRIVGRIEAYRTLDERERYACDLEREAVDTLPVGIIVVDEALNILVCNASGRELIDRQLGYDPSELRDLAVLGHDHPLVKPLIAALGTGKPVRSGDVKIGTVYLDVGASPMVAQGRTYGAALALVDVTERRAIAAKDERLRREMEFYLDLMSHDIRNFNQVSMGYLEMLELAENLTDEERSYLEKALGGVQGSNKLIADIKQVLAIRENGSKNIVPMDLDSILREDAEHVIKAHEGQRVVVNQGLGYGRRIMANNYVHDVFRHILDNAVKYDEHPDKVIDVDVIESTVDGEGYWTARIADRGPGLPDDMKKAVFERMSGRSTRGAGLGLSIVKLIVDSLGGRIWAEDRAPGDPSKGSVFVVQLRMA